MNNPIITTQKTSSRYLASQLIYDVLFIFIGIYFMAKGLSAFCTFLIFGGLSALYHAMVSSAYVDIYADRIEGKGMQKVAMQSINLRFDQITDISTSRGFMNLEATGMNEFLVINTSAGSYKIITTSARAKEIVDFCKNAQGKV